MSKQEGSESAISRGQSMKEEKMAKENEAPKRLSRKDFVKGAAAVAGVGALAGCAPAATPVPTTAPEAAPTCPPAEECPTCPTAWLPEKWDYEADLVIVGSGGGGLTAAIEAADAGASMLVLEKAPEEHMGGDTKCTGGFFVGSSEEAMIEYMTSLCWGTVPDKEIIAEYVKAIRELPDWIEQLGGTVNWMELLPPTYPLIPGGDRVAAPGDTESWFMLVDMAKEPIAPTTWNVFRDAAAERGISVEAGTIKCLTPATELIQDPNTKEILGVKALEGVAFEDYVHYTGGKEIYVKAKKAVILACGGYENNEEMRRNFAPHPHSAFVTFYGTPYNTGDGIVMAQSVGAKLWHLNKKECHAFACAPASKELGVGVVVKGYGIPNSLGASIYANRDGKRFMNEHFYSGHTDQHKEYDEFTHKLSMEGISLGQFGITMEGDDYTYSDYRNVPMYWVFDDTVMKSGSLWASGRFVGVHKVYEWSSDNSAELEKGWIVKADTIEELGKKIECKDFFGRVVGMDAAGLVETVNKYNQYCAAGKDADFGRNVSSLAPLSTPPFYAMEVCECQTNTQGGPEHNKYRQTLDAEGNPIPRLYTIGELGSIFGFLYNGGGNIPETYATGRIAAKHALALEPWA